MALSAVAARTASKKRACASCRWSTLDTTNAHADVALGDCACKCLYNMSEVPHALVFASKPGSRCTTLAGTSRSCATAIVRAPHARSVAANASITMTSTGGRQWCIRRRESAGWAGFRSQQSSMESSDTYIRLMRQLTVSGPRLSPFGGQGTTLNLLPWGLRATRSRSRQGP